MRKTMILLCASIFIVNNIGIAADNEPGQDGWIRLFDGQSLNDWRASENKDSFQYKDGMIIAHGQRSHLFYDGPVENHDFTNFELKADVMTFPGANSGIYFHTAYQPSGWPGKGFEVQVNNSFLGSGNYRELKKTGSLYGLRNVFASGIMDNEWFTMHITVQGKRIQIRRNNILVVDYIEPAAGARSRRSGPRLSHGTFALQGHDPKSKIQFKNIYVKPLPASSIKNIQSQSEIDFQKRITRYHRASVPLIDYHIHLKGGLTIAEALEKSRHAGITYGIAVNCGLGFPVQTDADAEKFFDSLKGLPVFKGMQAEGREWLTMFSKETIAQFDYVFTDSMTFTDRQGRRTRLWMPKEVHVDDPQDFMDMLVEKTVGILSSEPIDIYVNPTFLPAVIAKQYDTLWTPERMDQVIQAAVKNDVAIEINARYKLPSIKFIKRAKQAGAKFTFGTNNSNKNLGWCEYCLDVVDECGLKKKDIFIPRTGKKKIESWNPPKK
jgi:3-keto-disaccharide hydrolase